MFRRTITIIAFVIAIILTAVGVHYCNHKVIPLIRLALWFPLPYLLHAYEVPGILLSLIQFPLFACAFAVAIRRWQVRWVLIVFVATYILYASAVIAIIGPPR